MSSNIEWALPLAVPSPPKFSPAKVLCYAVPRALYFPTVSHCVSAVINVYVKRSYSSYIYQLVACPHNYTCT